MPNRIDAVEKVTGRAIYADDIKLDGMLYAKQLYSEHPHAKIISIDTKPAYDTGAIDVITADDCTGSIKVGGVKQDHYVLAKGKVRYAGDVVAVVAAKTPDIAEKACKAICVKYEMLEPILDPEAALKNNSLRVHDELPDNLTASFKVRCGNSEKAFAKAKKIFEAKFATQHIEHAYLEPESCVASKNPDGSVTIHAGMQHPFSTRRYVATFLGLPLSKVRVVQTTLGGGFGGKDDTISVVCARAALIALRTGKPVKITLTRDESMRESYKRHPFIVNLRMSVKDNLKIDALESTIIADGGPYCAVSPFVIWRPTVQCTGPYLIKNVTCDSFAAYTNGPLCGAMRGFGTPQYNFVIESFIDMVANELGISPVKFRRENFFKQGDTIHTGQKLSGHTVSIAQVVNEALEKFDYENKLKNCSHGKLNESGKLYGIGMACSYRGVSLGAEGNDLCSAVVNIQQDGSILLEVGVAENGQGLKTAMAAILCAEFGVEQSRVTYLDVDTSSVGDSAPTVASRGTLVGGNAVIDACRKIKELMKPVLATKIGKTRDYIFARDKIINPKNKKEIAFSELARACMKESIYLHAIGSWRGPKVGWDEHNGQGDAYFTYVYGCNAVEVEIDPSSGKVKVISSIGAHDVGRAINHQMLDGQIIGGMVMGMGQALCEELIVENGFIKNTNLNGYRLVRSTDVPTMQTHIVENPDPAGPYGAKAIGEPANELMAGAIGNAVFNATGIRFTKLPIRPEDVKHALQNK